MAMLRSLIRSFVTDSVSLQKRLMQCFTLGQYDEALKLGLQLKDQALKDHGENHPIFLHALGSLGQIYRLKGDHDQSIALTKEMHDKLERQFGEENKSTIRSKHMLGVCYRMKGMPDVALGLFHEALALRKKYAADEVLDLAENLMELGKCYLMLGEQEKARVVVSEGKTMIGEKYGYNNIILAKVLEVDAEVHIACNQPGKALESLRTALNMNREWFGTEHRNTQHTQTLLDTLLQKHPNLV